MVARGGPLDDTVPAVRAISARDLLTFTFGFGSLLEMFTAAAPWPVVEATDRLRLSTIGPPHPDVQPDPGTWVANFGTLPLLAQPGERWRYSRPCLDRRRPAGVRQDAVARWRSGAVSGRCACHDDRSADSGAETPGGLGPDFFAGRPWAFCQSVLDTGAFGWDGGSGTSWLADPAFDLIVIVLTQRMFETSAQPQAHRDIQAAAYGALA
jgi:CubicO group peptidase (beta-lactamase class C family)